MSGFSDRIAAAIMRRVHRLTPADRREWARAMAAEASIASSGSASLHFALGCLWAAVQLRIASAFSHLTDETALGLLTGALFCVHAAFPGTAAWPLIWPAVGGAAAAVLPAMKGRPGSTFALAGAKTGAASATIFFIGGLAFLWWVDAPDLKARIAVLGIGAALGILVSSFAAGATALCIPRSRS